MTTLLIVPAWSDQGGQCRIYSTDALFNASPLEHYRRHPGLYQEVGIMNSCGSLVCFHGSNEQRQELIDCQPLSAGSVFTFQNPPP